MAELIRIDKDYTDEKAANALLKYIKSKALFFGGYNLQKYEAAQQMRTIRNYYYQNRDILIYHFVLTFDMNREFLPLDKMYELAYMMCGIFMDLQVFFGIHIGDNGYHIHFAVNPVSITDGSKFCLTYSTIADITQKAQALLRQYSVNKLIYINKPFIHEFQFAEEYDKYLRQCNLL